VGLWSAPAALAETTLAELQASAQARSLHEAPTWRRLLYVRDGASEVISTDFFLAADGAGDPAAELAATLAAWYGDEVGDASPRCRFPARYLWLGRELALPPRPDPGCVAFERWAGFERLDSISALMVSGYLGNPASSFGHSLFKLNRRAANGEDIRLLDTSYSFGALVPKDENVIRYVYRGLTGAYEAGFTDKLYYARDQVYTRTQFRDIWEYRLALDPQQQRLLVSHLWEVLGRKYTYRFLSRNCGYRMAELVALATDRELAPDEVAWYAPAELFHDLMGVAGDHGASVAGIGFIPSSQRVLHHRFASLRPSEQAAVNRVIASEGVALAALVTELSPTAARRALDVLVVYYEYRLAAHDEAAEPALRKLKDRVLLARLALPVSTEPEHPVPMLPPVSDRHPPLAFGAGLRAVDGEPQVTLRTTGHLQDLADDPASGTELAVGDIELAVAEGGDVAVDRFDLIRVRRLQSSAVGIHGESRRSWQVRFGWRRDSFSEGDARAEVAGGVGRATLLGEATLAYGMLDLVLRDGTPADEDAFAALLQPMLGVVTRSGRFSLELEVADRADLGAGRWTPRGRLAARWRSGRQAELQAGVEHLAGEDAITLGVVGYW